MTLLLRRQALWRRESQHYGAFLNLGGLRTALRWCRLHAHESSALELDRQMSKTDIPRHLPDA